MATLSTKIDPNAPRVFIDSSVLLAGLGSRKGASYAILVLSDLGFIRPVICPYVFDEVERNVLAKFPAYEDSYRRIQSEIEWEVVTDPSADEVRRFVGIIAAKDAPVLAAAVNAAPKRLVTLDVRDFLKNPEVARSSKILICTPGDLLKDVRAAIARGFE